MSHQSTSDSDSSALEDEDTVMTYPDDEEHKGNPSAVQYYGYAQQLELDSGEDEQGQEEDEDDSDDQEDGGAAPVAHTQHFFPGFTAHSNGPLYQQQYHSTTYTDNNYDDYDDDDDKSEDGGAPVPPVDYLSIANILTSDLDFEGFEDGYYPHYMGDEYSGPVVPGDQVDHAHEENESEHEDMEEPVGSEEVPDHDMPTADEVHAAVILGAGLVGYPPPVITAGLQLQQGGPPLPQLAAGDQFDDGSAVWFATNDTGPAAFVNPNMSALNPGNYPLIAFLQNWAGAPPTRQLSRERWRFPWMKRITEQASRQLTTIRYDNLEGEQCDFQGLDWDDLGVPRRDARERRLLTYTNYTNEPGSDKWHVSSVPSLRTTLAC